MTPFAIITHAVTSHQRSSAKANFKRSLLTNDNRGPVHTLGDELGRTIHPLPNIQVAANLRSEFLLPDLLRYSEGGLFGRDAPRLPAPPLFAFDEIAEISRVRGAFGQGFVVARRSLGLLDWMFRSHFSAGPGRAGDLHD